MITNIKNKNERFEGDWFKEMPIFEMLLVKESKITLKLCSELRN